MSVPIVVTVIDALASPLPINVTEVDPSPPDVQNQDGNINVINTDLAVGDRIFVGTTSPTAAGYVPIVGDVWIT